VGAKSSGSVLQYYGPIGQVLWEEYDSVMRITNTSCGDDAWKRGGSALTIKVMGRASNQILSD
jgi:hypothetical protein